MIDRSPPQLLKEIILVDDASTFGKGVVFFQQSGEEALCVLHPPFALGDPSSGRCRAKSQLFDKVN